MLYIIHKAHLSSIYHLVTELRIAFDRKEKCREDVITHNTRAINHTFF